MYWECGVIENKKLSKIDTLLIIMIEGIHKKVVKNAIIGWSFKIVEN